MLHARSLRCSPRPVIALALSTLVGSLVAVVPTAAQNPEQVAHSAGGMVVTAHPLATWAGLRILEQGGNAADAAVAAGFAIAVVRPSMNSIGGRNQILIRGADGRVSGIDATTQVPMSYDHATAPRASYGYATIGIPGALAGLMRLYEEHATLPLEVLMQPALDYAEGGFRLLSGQAQFHESSADELRESEGARAAYLKPDGSPYRAGDLLRQPVLARTYRRIIEGGADAFYRGDIAAAMVEDIMGHGGFVTAEALADYRAEDARIVRGTYRGYDLVAMDVPTSGTIAIQALHIMENFDRAEHDDAEWALITAQAMALALQDRDGLGTDTAAARATSKAWAASKVDRVMLGAAVGATDRGEAFPRPEDESYTTHLSVADSTGMLVALTQTIGPAMGSKVVTPDLGFLYAVTLGGYLSSGVEPGGRARSGITPLFLIRDGQPVAVLGAAGGLRIVSAVIQAVTRMVDDRMTLTEALAAPRVHPTYDSTYAFTGMAVETVPVRGWSEAQVAWLESLGIEVTTTSERGRFGRIHGIEFDAETGEWIGVADPGAEGSAAGLRAMRPR